MQYIGNLIMTGPVCVTLDQINPIELACKLKGGYVYVPLDQEKANQDYEIPCPLPGAYSPILGRRR